jgi:hypothetical protein
MSRRWSRTIGWSGPRPDRGPPNPILLNVEIQQENLKWPLALVELKHRVNWPSWFGEIPGSKTPRRSWRSRSHVVQEFLEPGSHRLMVIRLELGLDGMIRDSTSWADLMRLKAEAGFADRHAVEIYPPAVDAPTVPQVRHLWLLTAPLPFGFAPPGERP